MIAACLSSSKGCDAPDTRAGAERSCVYIGADQRDREDAMGAGAGLEEGGGRKGLGRPREHP